MEEMEHVTYMEKIDSGRYLPKCITSSKTDQLITIEISHEKICIAGTLRRRVYQLNEF